MGVGVAVVGVVGVQSWAGISNCNSDLGLRSNLLCIRRSRGYAKSLVPSKEWTPNLTRVGDHSTADFAHVPRALFPQERNRARDILGSSDVGHGARTILSGTSGLLSTSPSWAPGGEI